ncbi:hypothetical protein AG1IA_10276 [Rhizoctonia solani AG-1 IA]|uniref:Uncharacterized protein n=1 Tax=Thanatephorus cucumeris (strain AG1-IA) TaxID=983506 RepID=L8WH33_THACA|nr:hypothetical protein AG1IA_10276 [Rhizoctonia solani AG-1 IA]
MFGCLHFDQTYNSCAARWMITVTQIIRLSLLPHLSPTFSPVSRVAEKTSPKPPVAMANSLHVDSWIVSVRSRHP